MTPEQREQLLSDNAGTNIPQDHLGELSKKTMIELQEMLSRQQKLLRNVKFLEKLQDKGQKIKNMAARLESLIQSRKDVDDTADLFEKMALEAAEARRVPPLHDDGEMDLLKMMANRSECKIYVDERTELKETNSTKYVNSYDRVIRQAEKKNVETSPKFFAHRSIKHKNVSEMTLESLGKLKLDQHDCPTTVELPMPSKKGPSIPDTKSDQEKTSEDAKTDILVNTLSIASEKSREKSIEEESQKTHGISLETQSSVAKTDTKLETEPKKNTRGKHPHLYDESLIAADRWHSPNHGPAKMISIEESIGVLEKQKASQEALKAQQAAEKLAQRLHINMTNFDPEGSRNLVYRNPANVDSEDEDSDDLEEDYPEGDAN